MASNTICRLCLEHAKGLLEIFAVDDDEDTLRIGEILAQYSIVEVTRDDSISNKICSNCWTKIQDFHEFCLKIQKIQESLGHLFYSENKNEILVANMNSEDEFRDDFTLIQLKNDEQTMEIVETPYEKVDPTEGIATHADESGNEAHSLRPGEPCPEKGIPDAELGKYHLPISKEKNPIPKGRRKELPCEETDENLITSFFQLNCELCGEHFDDCHGLFKHYDETHKIRGFITCCGRKYMKIKKISEHVMWHKDPELFKCTKCDLDKVFTDKKHLEAHMLTHMDDCSSVFHCEYCTKTFVKKYRFEQHKLTHLTPEEKKYICRDCGKPYATESLLRVHVRVVHLKSYARMCEICAKVFKSRVFFEKHQLEHMGKTLPKVQCQVCNAWMKNEHTMRAHMRLHEDAGVVHECDLCGKIGPSRNSILKHKRYVHFSERKFKCTYCEKAFKRALSLKEHMSVHTGEVLYKCTYCPRTFNSGANMFAHKKRAHCDEWRMEREREKCEEKYCQLGDLV